MSKHNYMKYNIFHYLKETILLINFIIFIIYKLLNKDVVNLVIKSQSKFIDIIITKTYYFTPENIYAIFRLIS